MSEVASSREQVKGVIRNIYNAFEELDAEKLDQNFSHSNEFLVLGTDCDEKFAGWDSYKDVHVLQFRALKKFTFVTKELDVRVKGDIAWISDRPHWEMETKDTGNRYKRLNFYLLAKSTNLISISG